ncbi:MAG: phosphate ABC transporter permease PstA [Phycisphaerales bacterium]
MGSKRVQLVNRAKSHAMYGVCVGFGVLIVALLVLVTAYILFRGFAGLLTHDAAGGITGINWGFFTQLPTGNSKDPGGMPHAIVGTIYLLGMASIMGIPMGVLTGIYLSEYRGEGWLINSVRFIADVLAGVPSIVVGILGYELVVRPIGNTNGYAGALAMAFIMIPLVARTTEEMLTLVPQSFREGSLALGATKSQTILKVVLPAASGSVVTGIMLALARIAGETAPLLFTVGASRFMPGNPDESYPSLMVTIYRYTAGTLEEKELAWSGILALIVLVFLLNLAIRAVTARSMALRFR